LFGERGAGCLQMGRVRIRKRMRNKGGEGRQSGHILTFTNSFTDGNSVGETVDDSDGKINTSPYEFAISNPSVIPSVI